MRPCLVYNLGLIDYDKAFELQERLHKARKAGAISDVLLLLQHPPVFTIGRSGTANDIIASEEVLDRENIQVFRTSRGGEVTYHGPGQLVGYPILHLRQNKLTVHQYVWNLEEMVMRTLADFGIESQRVAGRRGVWVGGEKVCSLGLRISSEVSMHGFSLNVNTDLRYFTYIIPCGITDATITSLSRLLGHEVKMEEVEEKLLRRFSEVFDFELERRERLSCV